MDYYSNDQLLEYFENEISNASKKRLTALRKEIDELKERQLKRVDEDIKMSVNRSLEIELREINTDHSFEINKIKSENSRILMNKRQELLTDIFKEVGKRILLFAKSEKYGQLMEAKLIKFFEKFSGKDVVFQIKEGDTILQKVIDNTYKGKHKIEFTDSIEYGGFLIACYEMGIEIDETLDFKLNEKKHWFYEESNLYI